MIIDDFLLNIKNNPLRNAFIYKYKNNIINKTYSDVYDDLLKMINYMDSLNIKPQTKFLIFIKPSYDFYIFMLASLYMSYQVIVIDSFKNKNKLKIMVNESKPDYIILNNKTKYIKNIFKSFRQIKSINISKYSKHQSIYKKYIITDAPVLMTFTSASTGEPKLIKRSIMDLDNQFRLVKNTFDIDNSTIVLALLPIYVLANLLFGITSLLFLKNINQKSVKELEDLLIKTNTNAISASVSKYILFTKPFYNITNCYTGGSLISLSDAIKIESCFPNAKFNYVYGASEAVLISKTTLKDYLVSLKKGDICIGNIVEGVEIEIIDADDEGIGEICVKGCAVLSTDLHHTADMGYLLENKVYLVGRKKMSVIEPNLKLYNYRIEMNVTNNYENVSKAAFIPYDNKRYLFIESNFKLGFEGIYEYEEYDFEIFVTEKLPVDIRHNYKIDYNELIKMIEYYNSKISK